LGGAGGRAAANTHGLSGCDDGARDAAVGLIHPVYVEDHFGAVVRHGHVVPGICGNRVCAVYVIERVSNANVRAKLVVNRDAEKVLAITIFSILADDIAISALASGDIDPRVQGDGSGGVKRLAVRDLHLLASIKREAGADFAWSEGGAVHESSMVCRGHGIQRVIGGRPPANDVSGGRNGTDQGEIKDHGGSGNGSSLCQHHTGFQTEGWSCCQTAEKFGPATRRWN